MFKKGVTDAKKSWNGEWCKGSSNWKQVSDGLKNQLQANDQEDGKFYISFDEFFSIYIFSDTKTVTFDFEKVLTLKIIIDTLFLFFRLCTKVIVCK